VFLANPNNPTGSYLPAAELERLRAGLSEQALLVIDAAYAEYVERDDYEPGIELVRAHDNVVMTRTFSKIHGLASLRLGWAFCPRDVADVLNRVRGPFNVSGPAQAAGSDHLARSRSHNSRWLAWFSAQAAGLGLEVAPSVGNFVLLGFPKQPGKDAASATAALKQRGILLRAMGAYGLPDCLRVTIGTGEDMEAVVQALGEFLS
jgi:histidinol-phosphate aminotransferase